MAKRKTEHEWERQAGESEEAYAAFKLYRDAGEKRSSIAVGKRLGKSGTIISRWCAANRWVERARAYDNALEREAYDVTVAEIREMNRKQAKLGAALQLKAIQALQKLDISKMPPKTIVEFLAKGAEIERRARMSDIALMESKEKESMESRYADDGLTNALNNSAKKVWD